MFKQREKQACSNKQTIISNFKRAETWPAHSHEYKKRENALVRLFIETGMSTRLCEMPSFRVYIEALDSKCKTPGRAKLDGLIALQMDTATTCQGRRF